MSYLKVILKGKKMAEINEMLAPEVKDKQIDPNSEVFEFIGNITERLDEIEKQKTHESHYGLHYSSELNDLLPALVKVQSEIDQPEKNSKGARDNERYADLIAHIEKCQTILGENGFVVLSAISRTQKQTSSIQGREYDGSKWKSKIVVNEVTTYVLDVETTLFHKSGQWMKIIFPGESGGVSTYDKAGVLTACRRYNLACLLNLAQREEMNPNNDISNRSVDEEIHTHNQVQQRIPGEGETFIIKKIQSLDFGNKTLQYASMTDDSVNGELGRGCFISRELLTENEISIPQKDSEIILQKKIECILSQYITDGKPYFRVEKIIAIDDVEPESKQKIGEITSGFVLDIAKRLKKEGLLDESGNNSFAVLSDRIEKAKTESTLKALIKLLESIETQKKSKKDNK